METTRAGTCTECGCGKDDAPSPEISDDRIVEIVRAHEGERGSIIAILTDVQVEYNYLPKHALEIVARETKTSLVNIYGIATFYGAFSLEPRGRHLLSVCTGTACHVRGAPNLIKAFEDKLNVNAGGTTEDREFTFDTVRCLGACALGPVAVVDGHYYGNMVEAEVEGIVDKYYEGGDGGEDEQFVDLDLSCPLCNRSLLNHGYLLDGRPMVMVTVVCGRKHGWLRLSSQYGDQRVQSEFEIPPGSIVEFFCPRCHGELKTNRNCPRCEAPMIPLLVKSGGIVQICSRHGCKEHLLTLND
jgi:NADH:ubiquinone oxidoreductase subunit E